MAKIRELCDLYVEADVILPAASYLESEGEIINYLGKTKQVHQVVAPAGEAKQHGEIIAALIEAMGSKISAKKKSAPKASKASFSPFEKKAGLDTSAADVMNTVNTACLNHSRLLWLTESHETVV